MDVRIVKAQLGAVADVILSEPQAKTNGSLRRYASGVLAIADGESGIEGIEAILKQWISASLAAMSIGLKIRDPHAALYVALLESLRNEDGLRLEVAAHWIAVARAFAEGRARATANGDVSRAYADLECAFFRRLECVGITGLAG
jgi:hypothetical protein